MSAQLNQVDLSDRQIRNAVSQVLRVAPDAENFFDLCDTERLNWMLGYAFQLGRHLGNVKSKRRRTQSRASSRRKGS